MYGKKSAKRNVKKENEKEKHKVKKRESSIRKNLSEKATDEEMKRITRR